MSAPDVKIHDNLRHLKTLVGVLLLGIAITLYQWIELVQIRQGNGAPLCTLSENIDCVAVWNSPLSTFVHKTTGLPFAAWGLIWCLVCLGLAGIAMRNIQRRQSSEEQVLALRLVAASGAVISIALLSYSAYLRIFCPTCILFYLTVAATTYISFKSLSRNGPVDWFRTGLQPAGWLAVWVLVLIYPGLQTPMATTQSLPAPSAETGESPSKDALARFLAELEPDALQAVSDSLYFYRNSPEIKQPVDPKRITIGPRSSPVHIAEWVEIRCPHCRNLHAALSQIKDMTPKDSWTLETHYFPLDSECNQQIQNSSGSGVSCLAAKILICLAGTKKENEIRTQLFEAQQTLTVETIWKIAAPTKQQKSNLQNCIGAAATQTALQQDISGAVAYGIEGTPLVVINGRQAPAIPVFIYTLILAGGDDKNPAFTALPTPNPDAFKQQ